MFATQQAKVVAEILRHGMKSDDREITADCEQDHPWTVPPESRIELERARQNLSTQKRAGAVTDDDDLLGLALARDPCKVLGKTVDARIPFRPPAVREFPGPDRVGQQIKQICQVFRVFQHGAKGGDEQRRRRGYTEQVRKAQRLQTFPERESNA